MKTLKKIDKLILLVGIMSFGYALLYQFIFIYYDELFYRASALGKFFYDFCMAIFAGIVVYFLTVFKPRIEREKALEREIRKEGENILISLRSSIYFLLKATTQPSFFFNQFDSFPGDEELKNINIDVDIKNFNSVSYSFLMHMHNKILPALNELIVIIPHKTKLYKATKELISALKLDGRNIKHYGDNTGGFSDSPELKKWMEEVVEKAVGFEKALRA